MIMKEHETRPSMEDCPSHGSRQKLTVFLTTQRKTRKRNKGKRGRDQVHQLLNISQFPSYFRFFLLPIAITCTHTHLTIEILTGKRQMQVYAVSYLKLFQPERRKSAIWFQVGEKLALCHFFSDP